MQRSPSFRPPRPATFRVNPATTARRWPTIRGVIKKANDSRSSRFVGTRRSDELLGHHGSDVLSGRGRSDILWGDHDGSGQPASQNDLIYGGSGNDFIYGSHGRNVIYGGRGNDAISVHYGRGVVDCGPGRDIYHVARTRKRGYRFVNCERVDYRSARRRATAAALTSRPEQRCWPRARP